MDRLDILGPDVTDVSHEISNVALAIRDLLVDVMVAKDLVDLAQNAGNVTMDIDDACVVGLIQCQRAHCNLGQVYAAKCAAGVDIAHEGIGHFNTDGPLRLLGATADVGGQNDIA